MLRIPALALAFAVLAAAPPAALAADMKTAPAPSGADAAFDRFKALEGTWAGKAEGEPTTVTYHSTGAGSAVVETLFPGTPHEMVSVYHEDGDRLVLTHYCAAGNQPTMKTVPNPGTKSLDFEFDHGTNMKPTDEHMHAVRFTFVDADHIESSWTSWKDGKATQTVTFTLARKK